MLDPSVRAQYDISYVRSFLGPDLSNKKKPVLENIILTICLIWMFVFPCVFAILGSKVKLMTVRLPDGEDFPVWAIVWFAGIIFSGFYITSKSKRDRFNLAINASFIQELSLTDKNTKEVHSGYLFVEGYDLINYGTASAGAMARWDDMPVKTRRQRNMERSDIASAIDNKRKQNVEALSALFHEEEFQQRIANAVIRNEAFPKGMKYLYFEKCRPLKKKHNSRYYAVPGYRGIETRIAVPLDCGFDEYISSKDK